METVTLHSYQIELQIYSLNSSQVKEKRNVIIWHDSHHTYVNFIGKI